MIRSTGLLQQRPVTGLPSLTGTVVRLHQAANLRQRQFASQPQQRSKVPPIPRSAEDLRRVAVDSLPDDSSGDGKASGARLFFQTPEQIREARERRRHLATHWRLENPVLVMIGLAAVIAGAGAVNFVFKPDLSIPVELEQEYEEKFYPVPEDMATEPMAMLSARDRIISTVAERYGSEGQGDRSSPAESSKQ